MITKALFVLPFAAFALIAAKAPPPAIEPPMPSIAAPADVTANPANKLTFELSNGGTVVIQLRPDIAPKHVERIQTSGAPGLLQRAQLPPRDPRLHGPGRRSQGHAARADRTLPDLKAEFTAMPFLRGTVAAARTGDNLDSANSQFFIMFIPNAGMNGKYTIFGRVISGMDAVDKIAPGEPPAEPTKIVRATFGG